MKQKIKLLLFDFDGTISDARKLAENCLIEVLDEYGFDFDKRLAKKLLGSKMPEIFKKLGLHLSFVDKARKKFFKKMIKGAKQGKIKLCVSVKPLYDLKKQGYKFIVISNSETSFIKASIKKLKIKKLFSEIYGAEKFPTKEDILKKLFKKHRIKPSQAVYIGDRFSDIEYARKAGCLAIAIHNKCSWSDLKTIKKEKPDFIIKDFYGLKKVLEKLNG